MEGRSRVPRPAAEPIRRSQLRLRCQRCLTRLIQISHLDQGRRVALVENENARLLEGAYTVYDLAQSALAKGKSLEQTVQSLAGKTLLDYEPIHSRKSDWRILPSFDHPAEPARCLVTGTGLTHKASAENRQ